MGNDRPYGPPMLLELLVIAAMAKSDQEQTAMVRECFRRYGLTAPELERAVIKASARRLDGLIRYH